LQTLLSERFQLAYHRETRQVTVYRLAVAKDGPKLVRPSIFAALQGIGSKLDTTRGPMELIVVDRVERPSEN